MKNDTDKIKILKFSISLYDVENNVKLNKTEIHFKHQENLIKIVMIKKSIICTIAYYICTLYVHINITLTIEFIPGT